MLRYCTRCKVVHFDPKELSETHCAYLNERDYEGGKVTRPRYWCHHCNWWQVMEVVPK